MLSTFENTSNMKANILLTKHNFDSSKKWSSNLSENIPFTVEFTFRNTFSVNSSYLPQAESFNCC